MDYLSIFGANVRAYRAQKNLSQEALAKLSNLNRTYISSIERGEQNTSLKNIVQIALALNIEPYKLLIFRNSTKKEI